MNFWTSGVLVLHPWTFPFSHFGKDCRRWVETKIPWPMFKVLGHRAAKCGSPGLPWSHSPDSREKIEHEGKRALPETAAKQIWVWKFMPCELDVDILQVTLPSGKNCLFLGWVVSRVEFWGKAQGRFKGPDQWSCVIKHRSLGCCLKQHQLPPCYLQDGITKTQTQICVCSTAEIVLGEPSVLSCEPPGEAAFWTFI